MRKPGRDQFDATRKLDAEVRNRFRPEAAGPDSKIQNVPAAAAVLVDEVKVVAADLQPFTPFRETKTDETAAGRIDPEDVLVENDLGQRAIRRLLGRNREITAKGVSEPAATGLTLPSTSAR